MKVRHEMIKVELLVPQKEETYCIKLKRDANMGQVRRNLIDRLFGTDCDGLMYHVPCERILNDDMTADEQGIRTADRLLLLCSK